MTPIRPVVFCGDSAVDMVVRLPGAPGRPATEITPEPELVAGGAVANSAAAAAKLGVKCAFMGSVGADGYGEFLRRDFEQQGVDTHDLVVVPGAFTLMVICVVDRTGERFFGIYPAHNAAGMQLRAEQINEASIRESLWLHVSGLSLLESPTREAVLHALRVARAAGVPSSIDLNLRLETDVFPEPYREAVFAAVKLSDVVLGAADEELPYLSGVKNPIESGRIISGGKRTVIPRLGAEGSLAITPTGEVHHVPAFKVDVVDTIGAGDAFNGGFIAAMVEGHGVFEALRWGNAVGAINVSREGARGLPTRAELDEMLSRG
ncbi:MAG: sugar kinase [Anaerolineae bacterium]|nr:sugar kinase [Anaerolineae bacterium]